MKYPFCYLITGLLLIACNNSSERPSSPSSDGLKEIQKSHVDSTAWIEVDGMEMGPAKVEIKWVEFEGGKSGVADKINAGIREKLITGVMSVAGDDSESGAEKPADIPAAAANFIKSYNRINDEIGGEMPWVMSVYLTKEYASSDFLSLHLNTESFTGGAHGYNGNYFMLFDPNTGDELKISKFIADTAGLKSLLEQQFRADHDLKPADALSKGGLFEEFDRGLPVPSEMSFTSNGLMAIYNPYEIAPFSEGTIVIVIPDSKLTGILVEGKKP